MAPMIPSRIAPLTAAPADTTVNDEVQRLRPEADAYTTTGHSPVLDATYGGGYDAPNDPIAPSLAAPAVEQARPFYKRRRLLLGVALFALIAAGIGLAMVRGGKPAAVATPASALPLVSVVVPGKAPVSTYVTFTGAIAARYDMPIGVEDGGRIAAVLVEAGDRVRAGQVLARLDTSVVASQVASLRAQLEQAKAEAVLAQQELKRAEQIVNSVAALSQSDVDRRRADVATKNARVQAAQAQLAEVQARLGRTEIKAPADGIVLTRTAEVGQTATPGGPALFRLGRGGEVEMRGQVAEQDLPKLALGQPARVRITGVTDVFEGKVRLLGAVIDPQTRLGEIRVALKPNPNLRPGAFARGEVELGREARPVLPQTAVLADASGNYVLVVGADDKVVRKPVTVAGTNASGVIVASGLTGDERVIATAGAFLREGEKVRTAPMPAASTAAAVLPVAASKG
jgi:RND family efflux transporter MFP subunit